MVSRNPYDSTTKRPRYSLHLFSHNYKLNLYSEFETTTFSCYCFDSQTNDMRNNLINLKLSKDLVESNEMENLVKLKYNYEIEHCVFIFSNFILYHL